MVEHTYQTTRAISRDSRSSISKMLAVDYCQLRPMLRPISELEPNKPTLLSEGERVQRSNFEDEPLEFIQLRTIS